MGICITLKLTGWRMNVYFADSSRLWPLPHKKKRPEKPPFCQFIFMKALFIERIIHKSHTLDSKGGQSCAIQQVLLTNWWQPRPDSMISIRSDNDSTSATAVHTLNGPPCPRVMKHTLWIHWKWVPESVTLDTRHWAVLPAGWRSCFVASTRKAWGRVGVKGFINQIVALIADT